MWTPSASNVLRSLAEDLLEMFTGGEAQYKPGLWSEDAAYRRACHRWDRELAREVAIKVIDLEDV